MCVYEAMVARLNFAKTRANNTTSAAVDQPPPPPVPATTNCSLVHLLPHLTTDSFVILWLFLLLLLLPLMLMYLALDSPASCRLARLSAL